MIKFTLIKRLKTNNRFNYTPRYYKGKEDVDPKEYKTKMDMYYETFNKNDFGNQWRQERSHYRNRGNVAFNSTVWIIIAILVFLFLWIIDFDLSIFTQSR
ncbi:MAG: hypothetical protein CMC74_10465 [Flavobacteriaceae bacterium]|nr:hypothetical protein [Flavobacteriaceae bacterium]|tara:strand:- start:212 stop:511 length:300 start_codon:yes stop_codon:yes gene_type:complete